MQSRALGAAAMAGVAVALAGEFAAGGTTHCVNPGGTGGCYASIQAAMDDARNGDIIAIDAGTYVENLHSPNGRTITLRGAGAGLTVIDAGGNFAAVSSQGVMTLRDLSTENASVMCLQLNIGRLERVHVSNCGSFGVGAARLSLVDSTVESANVCLQVSISGRLERAQISNCGFAGVDGIGRLTLVDSTVDSAGTGVVVGLYGGAKIIRSTMSGSSTAGIRTYFRGKLRMQNSTISGNAVGLLMDGGVASLSQSTIAANSNALQCPSGVASIAGGVIRAATSIIADNSCPGAFPDIAPGSLFQSRGYNLIEDGDFSFVTLRPTDITGVDPLLGPLQDNGGPTATHELLPGSPALGAIPKRPPCAAIDQRGVSRLPTPCDIGAFEAP